MKLPAIMCAQKGVLSSRSSHSQKSSSNYYTGCCYSTIISECELYILLLTLIKMLGPFIQLLFWLFIVLACWHSVREATPPLDSQLLFEQAAGGPYRFVNDTFFANHLYITYHPYNYYTNIETQELPDRSFKKQTLIFCTNGNFGVPYQWTPIINSLSNYTL